MSFLIPFDMDKVERANLRKILSQNKPKISNVNFDRANRKLLVKYTGDKAAEEFDIDLALDQADAANIIRILQEKGIALEDIEEFRKTLEGQATTINGNITSISTNVEKLDNHNEKIMAIIDEQVKQDRLIAQNTENIEFINELPAKIRELENKIDNLKPGESDEKIQKEIELINDKITNINIPEFDASDINTKLGTLQIQLQELKDRPVVESIALKDDGDLSGQLLSSRSKTKYLTQHGGTALDSLYRKWLAQ